LLLLIAVGLGFDSRHWVSLAGRSRVGARSEGEVQRVLTPLRSEGWRLRHSLPWRGRGDIDSVAIAPTGVAIVIETKTRAYDSAHLSRVYEQTADRWAVSPPKVVPPRRACRPVPRSRSRGGALRARRACGLDRSPDAGAEDRGGHHFPRHAEQPLIDEQGSRARRCAAPGAGWDEWRPATCPGCSICTARSSQPEPTHGIATFGVSAVPGPVGHVLRARARVENRHREAGLRPAEPRAVKAGVRMLVRDALFAA